MNRFAKFVRDYSFATFFIPLGIILIVLAVFLSKGIDNTKNFIKTEAVVSGVELFEEEYYDGETHYDATYTIYVKYTVDGKEYDEEYGIFHKMNVGDKVTISYNPDNPADIAQPITAVWPIACGALGIVSFVVAIVGVVRRNKKNKALKQQEESWNNEH